VPTYQYACTACGHELEAVQSFTDAALTECPECGGALRKVFSAVGVVFKGSGFYKTDSRASSTASSPATPNSEPKKESSTSTPSTSTTSSSSTPATT
jgi:putative FmdB family regulatory protein